MFTIVIQEKGGDQRRMVFNKPEVTIGRVQGNDIVLPKGNVSKRHARVVLKDAKFIIVDLKSTNGTYVNGRKITSPLVVKNSDKIYIGDFIVGVDEATSGEGDGPSETTTAPPTPNIIQQLDPDVLRPSEQNMETSLSPVIGAAVSRPVPPRPAPIPNRDNAASRTRDLGPAPVAPPPGRAPGPPAPARSSGSIPPLGGIPPLAPVPPPPPGAMHGQGHAEPFAPAPFAPTPDRGDRQDKFPARQGVGPTPYAVKITTRPVSAAIKRSVRLDPLDSKIVKVLDLQGGILEGLRTKLALDSVPLERLGEEELWQKAERVTIDLVENLESSGELPKYVDQDALIKDTLNEALGLGPLEDLLADDTVDEIIIDRRDRVVIGTSGVLRGSGKAFSSEEVFERVVKRLVHEAGSAIDHIVPTVDVRMRDGTRLTAALPPVATRGACLVLKKLGPPTPQLNELVQAGVLSSGMVAFLATCVAARRNILVCGGPGSGKAVVVAAIAAAAPAGERVVSVEEVAKLSIARDEWVQLEARTAASAGREIDLPPHSRGSAAHPGDPWKSLTRDGAGVIDMAAVLEMALRLGPDRLVVGDVRGREAATLVHTLSAHVDGAVVAVAGDGVNAALNRLALLVRASASSGSDMAYRELVASAFDIAVHVVRRGDGAMKVQSIEELISVSETAFETQPIFVGRDSGFSATGAVPRFYSELEASGIQPDRSVFR